MIRKSLAFQILSIARLGKILFLGRVFFKEIVEPQNPCANLGAFSMLQKYLSLSSSDFEMDSLGLTYHQLYVVKVRLG